MEKPILFSTPMVKAILDGSKIMTRRVIKNQDLGGAPYNGFEAYSFKDPETLEDKFGFESDDDCWVSPYGELGDLLWIRETFAPYIRGNGGNGYIPLVKYRAGNAEIKVEKECLETWEHLENNGYHWRPSIHMHKIFARIWLKVKSVRVERLQDISEDDAVKEGVEPNTLDGVPIPGEFFKYPIENYENDFPAFSAIESFKTLWDSINGKPRKDGQDISWSAHPWVWVVEFERTEKPHAPKEEN